MADISNTLMLDGRAPEVVYKSLTDKGVSDFAASTIIGQWIIANSGHGTRHFSYSEPVAAQETDCAPTFVRSFVHADWIDGVSVVQAGLTSGEEGFNDRLHRIEDDLDALSADIKRLFGCLAELRASVAQALSEAANGLNQIDQDVGQLWSAVDATHGSASSGPIIAQTPKYLGVTKYFDQPVNVWQTDQGIYTLPAVQAVDPASDPQVNSAGNFGQFAQANAALAQKFSAGPVTVQSIIDGYGSNTIDAGGTTVAQALSVLPADAQYTSLDSLTGALAGSNAAVIRATGASDAVLATSFTNLASGITTVANAPVDRLQSVSSDAASALSKAGISTVGALATATPDAIHAALSNAGLSSSLADATALTGMARTLNSLG
jgi:hypothetical protein